MRRRTPDIFRIEGRVVILLGALVALGASAQPFAHEHAREAARQRLSKALGPVPFGPPVAPALDYRDLAMKITLNPITGALTAAVTIKVAAKTQSLAELGLLIDSGLTVSSATISGSPAVVTTTPVGPSYNHIALQPSLSVPAGIETTAQITYAGTLLCLPYAAGSAPECTLGTLGFFNDGSLFPMLIDSASGLGGHDSFTRSLDLTVPSGQQVVASADLISSIDTGAELKTLWRTGLPVSRVLRFYLLTGALSSHAISSTPPAALFTAPSGSPFVSRLVAWTPVALEAMEAVTARKPPYPKLNTVLIPETSSFIGSASYAMTMLNESYATLGDEGFQEIWAHENIHQWWGVAATPADYDHSRLLTEGITTLLQFDATARRTPPADPDLAMARRLRETQLVLKYRFKAAAPVPLWVADPDAIPSDAYVYNAWAYFKGAATLDALRLFVGRPAFEAGLRRYLDVCVSPAACGVDDFQRAIEGAAPGSLDKFFAQWIRGAASPRVSVGFSSAPDNSVKVTLEQLQGSAAYLPLELWLVGVSGNRRREAVVLDTVSRELTFSGGEPIRSVQLNPRHQGLVEVRSRVDGDLDFDGEVDGADLLTCAWRLGRKPTAASSAGSIFGGDLDFEPMCDRDGDATLTPADLTSLAARFPELR